MGGGAWGEAGHEGEAGHGGERRGLIPNCVKSLKKNIFFRFQSCLPKPRKTTNGSATLRVNGASKN